MRLRHRSQKIEPSLIRKNIFNSEQLEEILQMIRENEKLMPIYDYTRRVDKGQTYPMVKSLMDATTTFGFFGAAKYMFQDMKLYR